MSVFAVVPVKRLQESKRRLSKILRPRERQTLMLTMLEDILNALSSSSVHRTVIVSPDPKVQAFAEDFGTAYLQEESKGLNKALEQSIDWCIRNDAEVVLILPADIPLITSEDIDQILNLGSEERSLVVTPSKNGGTNALLEKPPNLIKLRFGKGSFSKHLAEASKMGVLAKVYRSRNMETDIDSAEDLENLLETNAETASHRFLRQIRLPTQLRSRMVS